MKNSLWRKRQDALDKKAENARELGLDYEPCPSKEWTDSYLEPPINIRKIYGNALEFTAQEKALMKQIKENT